jgi:hypothetical protein
MSCSTGQNKVAQIAAKNGISPTGSKNGYVTGSTSQVATFASSGEQKPAGPKRTAKEKAAATGKKPSTTKKGSTANKKSATKPKQKRAVEQSQSAASNPGKTPGAQASFFETYQAEVQDSEPLLTQRQIKVSNEFTPDELQTISVQLRLGTAAAARHIRELESGTRRGIGYSDPRLLDWARLDQQNFQFLIDQVAKARRNGGYIDTSSLKQDELFDLWEFSKFEADRAHRNIDHLFSGGSHLKGPTAEYTAKQHKLDARFYTFLADRLEPMITPEMVAEYYVGL